MRKPVYLCLLCLFFTFSCMAQSSKGGEILFNPDSMVVQLWGDSVSRIIFTSHKATAYTLAEPKNNELLHPGKIAGKIPSFARKLDATTYAIFKALMMSRTAYDLSPDEPKGVFTPYIAIEVKQKKERCYILLGLSTESWAVWHNGQLKRYKTRYNKLLVEYLLRLLPEDKYLQTIAKHNYDEAY